MTSPDWRKRVCHTCTVRAPCLTEALAMPRTQDYGVWGGLSEHERRRLRRRKDVA